MRAEMRRFLLRLRNFLLPHRAERELSREVGAHLELVAGDLQARGLSESAAAIAARRAFGGVEQVKERQRDERSFRWLEDVRRDVIYSGRTLNRSRGFAIVAVVTIAAAVAANSAFFALLNAVLLRPLPVRAPEELVGFTHVASDGSVDDYFSYPRYLQWRDRAQGFAGVATGSNLTTIPVRVSAQGDTEVLIGDRVSGNYFDVLGVRPALGRLFTTDDERRAIAVIGHRFWTDRFGADARAIGRQITIDETVYDIVGVTPPAFGSFVVGRQPDVWFPVEMLEATNPMNMILRADDARWLRVIGRRRQGVSLSRLQAEVDTIFKQGLAQFGELMASQPEWNTERARRHFDTNVRLFEGRTGSTPLRKSLGPQLVALGGIVVVVLLVSCANVANLLLARATARRTEMATRLALGASRARLIRQLFTESLLLGAVGGSAGLLVTGWTAQLLFVSLPQEGVALDLSPDFRVAAFTIGLSLVACLLFGLVPAFGATRVALAANLATQAAVDPLSRPWLNRALVSGQVALAFLLLASAGLFARSLVNLKRDAGFDYSQITTFGLRASPDAAHQTRARQFEDMLSRLEALPGVVASSFSIDPRTVEVSVADDARQPAEPVRAQAQDAGPRHFSSLGIPLLQGRDLSPLDMPRSAGDASAPTIAVINETMAWHYFRGNDPIGQLFTAKEPNAVTGRTYQVVGVARDWKLRSLRDAVSPTFVTPMPLDRHLATFTVRTVGVQAGLPVAIRRIVREESTFWMSAVTSLAAVVDRSIAQELFISRLALVFGGLGLVIATVGVYGALSYFVARRRRELAIRISLGAQREQITLLVRRDNLALVGTGLLIGVPLALIAGRLVQHLLYGVRPFDPATASAGAMLLVGAALLAGLIPASRAGRVDPIRTLRG